MRGRAKNSFWTNLSTDIIHIWSWITSPGQDILENPAFRPRSKEELDNGEVDEAIYCLHGTADTANSFRDFAEGIMTELPSNISAIHLVAFDKRATGASIEDFAQQLNAKIIENEHKNIRFVCHSRGGLVGAHYKTYFSKDSGVNVKHVYTVGTPFFGSPLALALLAKISKSVGEMQIDGDYLKKLQKEMRERKDLDQYSFYASDKDIIVPIKYAFFEEKSESLTILNAHDHLSMMRSQRLIDGIALHLLGKGKISLETVCHEVAEYIDELKKTGHFWSADPKISLLQTLQNKLSMIQTNGRGEDYSDANTIGNFIDAFIHDESQNLKPIEILKTSLDLNWFFSHQTNTTSYQFVTWLIMRYKNVPIISDDLIEKNDLKVNEFKS